MLTNNLISDQHPPDIQVQLAWVQAQGTAFLLNLQGFWSRWFNNHLLGSHRTVWWVKDFTDNTPPPPEKQLESNFKSLSEQSKKQTSIQDQKRILSRRVVPNKAVPLGGETLILSRQLSPRHCDTDILKLPLEVDYEPHQKANLIISHRSLCLTKNSITQKDDAYDLADLVPVFSKSNM